MTDPWHTLIERIHAALQQAVIVVTGGGAMAISDLLSIPGGSRTLLEAVVPYSASAVTAWLGKRPDHFCSEEAALAMAAVAFERAKKLAANDDATNARAALIGLSCTASLASDRPKKGEHRAHVAIQTESESRTWSLVLTKDARSRLAEEQLVGHMVLCALAQVSRLDAIPALELLPGEKVSEDHAQADSLLIELLAGQRKVVWSLPVGVDREPTPIRGDQVSSNRCPPPARPVNSEIRNPKSEISPVLSPELSMFARPKGLLCGSFHPLHFGHEQLRAAAEPQLGGPVYYEMSIRNVDKPPLDFLSIGRRRAQFTSQPLALTAAPTFAEKAAALPGAVFVVGVDTAERIVNCRYYQGSDPALREALAQIRSAGCRFLVAGRQAGDRFETLTDVAIPAEFSDLFAPISPGEFRADVSSTELRRAESAQ